MRPFRILALLLCSLASACINLPEVDSAGPDTNTPPVTPLDSGTDAATDPPDSGHTEELPDSGQPEELPDSGHPEALTVQLVTPGEPAIASTSIDLMIELSGPTPEQVELLLDDAPVTTVTPPYSFRWDTSTVAEGTHSLKARATKGGTTYVSEAHTLVVDHTPPRFVSRVPAPLSENVLVSQAMTIQASFSEVLRANTVSASSVKLSSQDGELAATPVLSADGKTLTITPSAPIKVGMRLTVTVTNTVTDIAGNTVAPPAEAWTWKVPAFVPLAPPLSANPGRASANYPSLRFDKEGRALVAWVESDGTAANVYVRRLSNGMWEPLGGPLSANPGSTNVENCALAIDSMERPVVVWSENDSTGNKRVYVQRWTGSGWESLGGPQSNSSDKVWIDSVAIQTSQAGHLVIAWKESGTPTRVYVRRWTGSSWEALSGDPSATATGSASNFYRESLQLDSAGNPVVAWDELEEGSASVTINVRRWDGSAWASFGANTTVSFGLGPVAHVDKADRPIVAWSAFDGTARNVYVRRWSGTTWELIGDALSANPGETNAYPSSMETDKAGNLFMAAWEYDATGAFNVYVRRLTGTTWEPVGDALSANPGLTSTLSSSLRMDGEGYPSVVWAEGSETGSFIYVYRYNR